MSMDEQTRLDNALADWTDALLENRPLPESDDLSDLTPILRGLNNVIRPNEQASDAFRQQLGQRLSDEFTFTYASRNRKRTLQPATSRVLAMAASVAIILVAAALALSTTETDVPLAGAAVGNLSGGVILLVGVVLGLTVGFFLWRGKK